MEYGYVRVSAKEQNENRQMAAMRAFAAADRRIVPDEQGGKDSNRQRRRGE